MRVDRAVLAGWLLVTVPACVDTMVVGDQPACEPKCPTDLHCDLEVERCVQCKVDDDCVIRLNAPYCDGFGCVQCRTGDDCSGGRMCSAGACVECITHADCNSGLERFEAHVCELGSCVDRFTP